MTFLDSILAFPTVFFTILMGVALTYWIFGIVGAVGIDMLDGHMDLTAGAKAAGGLIGGAKAASGVLEGGDKAAGGLVGGAKAAGAELDGQHAGGHHGHDHDADADAGLMAALGFAGIPVTISGSFVIFASWTLAFLSRNT